MGFGTRHDWARRLRAARRAQGISQSDLAREVGCRQSAISMMERGHSAALSQAMLERIRERLGLTPDASAPDAANGAPPSPGLAYCPNPDCPSNLPVSVGDTVTFWPSAQPGSGRYCGLCGEVLSYHCSNPLCRSPSRTSACCMNCGTPWVTAPPAAESDPEGWTARRQQAIAEWRALRSGAG